MASTSRFLFFDHFFYQDINEMVENLNYPEQIFVIPASRWHSMAWKVFPKVAFESYSSAFSAGFESFWATFEELVAKEVEWIMACYRPTLFVLPSDTFFYIRPFITEFEKYGVKTFVLQKETTISSFDMEISSLEIRDHCPFMSVHMAVCSQRHKDFWIRAGADPQQITVSGQPRFDYYYRKAKEEDGRQRPKLLYLSFDDRAYIPAHTAFTWELFRQDIETVIAKYSDRWDVTVKRHPQQANSKEWLGKDVTRAENLADTRDLIFSSDVVVGFQTTALYEAVLAGRPVVYCAWGEEYDALKELLIRFDAEVGMTTFVNSRLEFDALLSENDSELNLSSKSGLAAAEHHLGVFDGGASKRVFDLMYLYENSPRIPKFRNILWRFLLTTGKVALWGCAAVLLYPTQSRLYRSARYRLHSCYGHDLRIFCSSVRTRRRIA